MRPVWHIQIRENDYDINTQNIIYTIQEIGMEVYCEKYTPGGIRYEFLPLNRPVIALGSISEIRRILKGYNGNHFYPGAWCDFKVLSCQSYYTHWGKYLLQTEYGFYTLGEIKRLKNYLFEIYGKNDNIFIRPDANNKEFTGELVNISKFDIWWANTLYYQPPLDMLCVIAKPEEIKAEYRLIMTDEMITGSMYKEDGIITYDEKLPAGIKEFSEEVVKTWTPHPIFCLDIASTPLGFKVVECGSINCAGFYKANIKKIITAMEKVAIKDYEEINN